MPSACIFDANAYQELPTPRLAPLIAAEAREDIVPYADPWVIMELVAKLARPQDAVHGRAALRKLLPHCGGGQPRMLIECEDQVCRILLGRSPPRHAETRARLGAVVQEVSILGESDDWTNVVAAAKELNAHCDRVEEERSQTLFDSVILTAIPSASSWDAIARSRPVRDAFVRWLDSGEAIRVLVASEIRRAFTECAEPVPDPIPGAMIDRLLHHFRFPFEVEVAVLRDVATQGSNMSLPGRRNAIWDAQIAFDAWQIVDGRRLTLVTRDRLLHRVARAIAQPGVQRLDDYLAERRIAA